MLIEKKKGGGEIMITLYMTGVYYLSRYTIDRVQYGFEINVHQSQRVFTVLYCMYLKLSEGTYAFVGKFPPLSLLLDLIKAYLTAIAK